MITLYHLNRSRSKRIIWLLEELGVEYQIEAFQRDKETSLAPESLKAVHPLGKSPVIKDDDVVVAESGAMTEYLIDKYAADRLAPPRDTAEYVEYLQWIHFAESSAMVPLLLKMFLNKDGCKTNFLQAYADGEAMKILTYLSEQLEGKEYLVGNKLSGADIMVFFVVDMVEQAGGLAFFPVLDAYLKRLRTHQACQKAEQLEKELG